MSQASILPPERDPRQISAMPALHDAATYTGGGNVNLIEVIRGIANLILKHILLIVILMAVCLGAAVVVTMLTPKVYQASGTLQIEPEQARVVSVDDVTQDRGPGTDSITFYQTQYGLLRSRTLAERVVTRLGPAVILGQAAVPAASVVDPVAAAAEGAAGAAPAAAPLPAAGDASREAAIARVLGSVRIDPVTGSRLARIEYRDRDPALAARVVNTYIDEYIASNLERRFEASSYARTFLERRLAELRTRLETAERELVTYAVESDLIGRVTPGSEGAAGSAPPSPLAALEASLAEATRNRIIAVEQLAALRGGGGQMRQVVESGTIQNLIQQRALARAEYQDKLQVFGPEYPDVRQVQARIAEFDRQLAAEERRIRDSVSGDAAAAARSAAAIEQQLSAEVARQRAADLAADSRAIQFNILRRDIDTNKVLYDGLLQRYREIGIAGGIGVNNVSIVDRAVVSPNPVLPQPLINGLIGLALGAVLSALTVILVENWGQSMRRPEDVTDSLSLPVLGVVPEFETVVERNAEGALLDVLAQPRAAATEAYHSVRAALQFARAEGLPRSMLVTSSRSGEGKSTTSVALSVVLARTGLKVLLVDADLRDPSLHKMFGMSSRTGLSNILSGEATPDAAIFATREPNLSLMPAGSLPRNAAEMVGAMLGHPVLASLEQSFDAVIYDGPPVMGLADAPIMATAVESVVFVVGSNGVSRAIARRAVERLRTPRIQLIGSILTKFNSKRESYGGYGYEAAYGYHAYGYGASDTSEPAKAAKNAPRRAARSSDRT